MADWVATAKGIMTHLIIEVLGSSAYIFENDPSNHEDYLDVIGNKPMWFGLISERLDSGYYTGPEGFYNDMLLMVDNCYNYNVVKYRSLVGDIGVTLENAFLEEWAKTSLATAVPPRPMRPMPAGPRPRPCRAAVSANS